jgi:hypothetical protein
VGVVLIVSDAAGDSSSDGPVREVLDRRAARAELVELGVWLPVSTLRGHRAARGPGCRSDPLPLTPPTAAAALEDDSTRFRPPPDVGRADSHGPANRRIVATVARPVPPAITNGADASVRRGGRPRHAFVVDGVD